MSADNQLKKPIQNLTLNWVFILLLRPVEVTVSINSRIHRFIVNLNEEMLQILKVMGPAFENYYYF